jgi:(p)ppGpp synthase/HD superfamily hydrolase
VVNLLASPEIQTARVIAELAHRGKVDQIGEPYIQHPQMVASLVQRLPEFGEADEQTQLDAEVAPWLHDVIDDLHAGDVIMLDRCRS